MPHRIKIRIESVLPAIGLRKSLSGKNDVARAIFTYCHVLDGGWALVVVGPKEDIKEEASQDSQRTVRFLTLTSLITSRFGT